MGQPGHTPLCDRYVIFMGTNHRVREQLLIMLSIVMHGQVNWKDIIWPWRASVVTFTAICIKETLDYTADLTHKIINSYMAVFA